MTESADEPTGLKMLGADFDDLRDALIRLVRKGRITVDVVNAELGQIRVATVERVQVATGTAFARPESEIGPEEREALLDTLKSRFIANRQLHEQIQWSGVEKALRACPEKLKSLQYMESTGGEPDVICEKNGEFVFGDCSAESPSGRRNCVFNKTAGDYLRRLVHSRPFNGNAVDLAAENGVSLMDAVQYRLLQEKLPMDSKTMSWLKSLSASDLTDQLGVHVGHRVSGNAVVVYEDASCFYDFKGFRAVLRVPKV
jgi:hypothetical protein